MNFSAILAINYSKNKKKRSLSISKLSLTCSVNCVRFSTCSTKCTVNDADSPFVGTNVRNELEFVLLNTQSIVVQRQKFTMLFVTLFLPKKTRQFQLKSRKRRCIRQFDAKSSSITRKRHRARSCTACDNIKKKFGTQQ